MATAPGPGGDALPARAGLVRRALARAIDLVRRAIEVPTRRGTNLVSAASLSLQLQDAAAAADQARRYKASPYRGT